MVPVTTGIAVACGGKKPLTMAVVTVADSTALSAPTLTRIRRFATSKVGTYVDAVSPDRFIQEIPSADFCH
jgi:hypothetical protein